MLSGTKISGSTDHHDRDGDRGDGDCADDDNSCDNDDAEHEDEDDDDHDEEAEDDDEKAVYLTLNRHLARPCKPDSAEIHSEADWSEHVCGVMWSRS